MNFIFRHASLRLSAALLAVAGVSAVIAPDANAQEQSASSVQRFVDVSPILPVAPSTTPAPTGSLAPAPVDPRGILFEAIPAGFSRKSYTASVENLLSEFEKKTGRTLKPGPKGKVVVKLFTSSGPGIATPKNLVLAVVQAMEKRGFERKNILLTDLLERRIREAAYPCSGEKYPPLTLDEGGKAFAGFPVLALDSEKFYDPRWVCESPLPSREIFAKQGDYESSKDVQDRGRQSFLPVPLFQDADIWINLPVAMDSPSMGVSGALANETIWNVSNQRRFLDNPLATPEAAVEIARSLEGSRPDTLVLHLLSLENWQYIGGPVFDSSYCVSEKRLWLSANPMILDSLMLQRINKAREFRKFPPVSPEPTMFAKANAKPPRDTTPPIMLGSPDPADITLVQLNPPKTKPAKGKAGTKANAGPATPANKTKPAAQN